MIRILFTALALIGFAISKKVEGELRVRIKDRNTPSRQIELLIPESLNFK
jgi:hypothetical protein